MNHVSRRGFLAATPLALASRLAAEEKAVGRVEGPPLAARAGADVLAAGGNAVDAVVAAAFAATVALPQMCGPGGYGGAFVAAVAGGTKVVAVDFNSTAPASLKPDAFPLDANGNVVGKVNLLGWRAVGVPGTLAGLAHVARTHGTWKLSRVLRPAATLARDGFRVDAGLLTALRETKAGLLKDPASAELYLPGGELPKVGGGWKNPDLATLYDGFCRDESVEAFYRGDAAKVLAEAFRANGGFVTAADLAAYRPLDVEAASWTRRGVSVFTPPPAAGGVTALQTLALLDRVGWANEPNAAKRLHRQLDAMRLAWDDRLKLLGDGVDWRPLFAADRLAEQAKRVEAAVAAGKPVAAATDGRPATGTTHLSACDAAGNFAALTLTHGGYFGAQVTVPGLGVTLGHGLSRFEPRPGHPNSPGPLKRPLHNMCPTVVLKDGRAVLAVGARGGRKIPNAVAEVLANFVLRGTTPAEALASPRLHTEGGLAVEVEPKADGEALKKIGYSVKTGGAAVASAVWTDGGGTR